MKILSVAWVALGWLILAGPIAAASIEDTARAYNEFGLNLLAQSRQSLADTNYFLSPAGLAFALAMTQNGAQGETLRQIMAALQVTNIPLAQLNQNNKALLDHLSKLDPKIKLEIANALWIASTTSIKPDFIAVNHRDYDAEVASDDFRNPATVRKINDWVSAHTDGKITGLLQPPLDPMLRLILLNAIYFKGAWQDPFDTNLTRYLPFTLGSGQAISQPRMSHTGHYAYFEEAGLQAVELPYAGRDVSMFVFLPKNGLNGFLRDLTLEKLESIIQRMHEVRKGTVELPRFKLENSYDLTGVLPPMGMPLAFSHEANFAGISEEPLHIGFVIQKTYLSVNEQGTEAAAATGVGAVAMAIMREPPPFHFIVDRPFFIAIREKQTGLILFLGAISDPR